MAIWRTHLECWITKAANTHSDYIILITFPVQQFCKKVPQCYVICRYTCLVPIRLCGFIDRP